MNAPVAARLRNYRLVWAVTCGSIVAFAGMLRMIVQQGNLPPEPIALERVFPVVAVALGALSIIEPRRRFAGAVATIKFEVEERASDAVGSFRESAVVTRVIRDPDAAILRTFVAFHQPFMMGNALAQSIAVFALALAKAGARPGVVCVYFVVALGLLASKFPRLSTITSAIERATGAVVSSSRT